jgi:cysteine-S-conjugate beta-lyase
MKKPTSRNPGDGTRLVRAGRAKTLTGPFVNPPVVHASTVLFDSVAEMNAPSTPYTYGRRGTPTSAALASALAELDGAAGAVLCPSGLNAIAVSILAFVEAGDHVLIADSVYGPARTFADSVLSRLGISVAYYDPLLGAGMSALLNERTRLVYVESPGSHTMEMQDIPAIADAAHRGGAVVVVDNTWATPLLCRPLALGADVALLSATKYIGGHADIMLGAVTANEACWPKLRQVHGAMGICVGPDDIYLGLRGLRTMEIRLRRHMESALAVASWLSRQTDVARVLHPALPGDPGHELWRRDMAGASGLFSIVLRGWSEAETADFLDGLALFGLGYSWGGFESLAIPSDRGLVRTAKPWQAEGPLVRIHIGLEDPDDLIADLEEGLRRIGRS